MLFWIVVGVVVGLALLGVLALAALGAFFLWFVINFFGP